MVELLYKICTEPKYFGILLGILAIIIVVTIIKKGIKLAIFIASSIAVLALGAMIALNIYSGELDKLREFKYNREANSITVGEQEYKLPENVSLKNVKITKFDGELIYLDITDDNGVVTHIIVDKNDPKNITVEQ